MPRPHISMSQGWRAWPACMPTRARETSPSPPDLAHGGAKRNFVLGGVLTSTVRARLGALPHVFGNNWRGATQ